MRNKVTKKLTTFIENIFLNSLTAVDVGFSTCVSTCEETHAHSQTEMELFDLDLN